VKILLVSLVLIKDCIGTKIHSIYYMTANDDEQHCLSGRPVGYSSVLEKSMRIEAGIVMSPYSTYLFFHFFL
jgi:hypothetical protein